MKTNLTLKHNLNLIDENRMTTKKTKNIYIKNNIINKNNMYVYTIQDATINTSDLSTEKHNIKAFIHFTSKVKFKYSRKR